MTQWLVVFTDLEPLNKKTATRKDRFLYWALETFLAPGFRHVYVMRPADAFDGWIVINPHSVCIDLFEVHGSDYVDMVIDCVENGLARVLVVAENRPRSWRIRGFLSCVSVVSHVLGIQSGFLTTPRKLYLNLERQIAGEMTGMGGVFSGPKAPDTSAADEARRKAEEERDNLKKQNEAKVRNRKNRNRGRALLTFGETGMAGVQDKKEKLG